MPIGPSGGSSSGAVGGSSLVYRYTVSGAVKASIDTGVDTPQAGSQDFANGDLLEVFMLLRTDEAVGVSQVDVTLNNDAGANYDVLRIKANGASTLAYANSFAANQWFIDVAGASVTANVFSAQNITIPDYAGTVAQKSAYAQSIIGDVSTTNSQYEQFGLNYRSTSAITRLKIVPHTAAKNFAVGSQLLIYKRSSS